MIVTVAVATEMLASVKTDSQDIIGSLAEGHMGKTLHIVFRSIVAMHSVRLKLCSVKYLVHCSIFTHTHTHKTIYIILGVCKTQPLNLVICPSITINNISPLTRYLYKTLLVIA